MVLISLSQWVHTGFIPCLPQGLIQSLNKYLMITYPVPGALPKQWAETWSYLFSPGACILMIRMHIVNSPCLRESVKPSSTNVNQTMSLPYWKPLSTKFTSSYCSWHDRPINQEMSCWGKESQLYLESQTDQEDGGLVSQRTIYPELEFRLLFY